MSARPLHVAALAAAFIAAAMSPIALADRISDIRNTRHNLSASGPGTTRASTETQVCVFCHTPHGATKTDDSGAAVRSPLWNRRIPAGSTYTPYTSSSLDAAAIQRLVHCRDDGRVLAHSQIVV